MRRRQLLGYPVTVDVVDWALMRVAVVLVFLLASFGSAEAQRIFHVGLLLAESLTCEQAENELGAKLATLGWSPGRHIAFDCVRGTFDELPASAATLVSHGPDVIWTVSGSGVRAAQAATNSIPIVMWAPDPVRIGLVASLARPAGTVTGFAIPYVELIAKRIEIAREAIPNVRRIGVIGAGGNNPTGFALQEEFARLSAALGIDFQLPPALRRVSKPLSTG